MASKILFCLLFIMIFLGIDEALSLEDSNYSIEAMHQEWMSLHRKNYSHLEEHQLRFKIFEENVNYINAFNAKPNQSYKLGINKFADLTNREFREIYASGHKPKGSHASASNEHKRFATQDLMSRPDNWDWVEHGAVTPVKNQGQCGT
ncbi:unnamed protein product [Cuscuta europaea]|uniref:Cathepsin propeptide inhibitor domain-containing protein n=1 Tax=Cuscuta europaea TaxID=41803 RepID=A0A9P1EKK8_CUSEU|nr:unnamed protein product [Cuscuta europaea]